MIELLQLSRYYGEVAALRDIELQIEGRGCVGFLGLNGAGKSTLMSILAGRLMPSSGVIRIDGQVPDDAAAGLRRTIGYCPDHPPIYPEMTVRGFLRHCALVQGVAHGAVAHRVESVLESCWLREVANELLGALSFGYRKRVGIARAIVHGPKLILLDEAVAGLDPRQIVEMRRLIAQLAETAIVITSSHILSEVAQSCARVILLHEGRLVADLSGEALNQSEETEHARIQLGLRGAKSPLFQRLSASELVTEVLDWRELPQQCHEVELRLVGDRREDLLRELAFAGIGVRRLVDARSQLESIFLRMTAGEGQGSAP